MRTLLVAIALLLPSSTFADDAGRALAAKVTEKAGGEEKLLKLFRMRERVLITATPVPVPAPDEKENRTSVVEVGGDWWLGPQPRGKDKVRVLCWAWSLRILIDPKSDVTALPVTQVAGQPAIGLRVSGSIKEPLDLWFDDKSLQLLAIDYTDTRHIFSEWKQTPQGHAYASHVTGYRFTNKSTGMLSGKQWYQSDILELTPLDAIPAEFKRAE